jgi:prevent-host-death family protein
MNKSKIESEKSSAIKGLNSPSRPPWQLQTAKARFSELFRRARAEGPQYVTRQGKEAVVVVPAEEFERLTGRTRQPRSLVEFFAASPLAGTELDLKRKADYGRKINL